MRHRMLVLIGVLALVAAACGSRVSRSEIQAADQQQAVDGETGTTVAADPTGASGKLGTLEVGCGEGDAKGATDTGVTDEKIGIAVISDKAGVVQVPTVGIEESVKAFVAYCNSLGGINGRELELTTYDSKIGSHGEVTKQACGNDDIFALVGTGSVLDDQGAQQMVDCGLVEVGAYAATSKKGLSERFFQPVPNPQTHLNAGLCKFLADENPEAVQKAAMLYTDITAASDRGKALMEGCSQFGFEYVYEKGLAIAESNFGSIVSEMQSEDVQYVTIVSDVSTAQNLLRSMSDQNFKPEIIDLGAQYYDPAMAKSPGADGALVSTNTVPFEEAEKSPPLQVYLHWLEEAAPGAAPTTLGVQAFSAGLLFAEAMKALGSKVTRDGLIDALSNIKEWDGGGLHMKTNPGDNKMNDCFLYVTIKDGEFERYHPDKGFDCDESYVIELEGDYGTGAKAKG